MWSVSPKVKKEPGGTELFICDLAGKIERFEDVTLTTPLFLHLPQSLYLAGNAQTDKIAYLSVIFLSGITILLKFSKRAAEFPSYLTVSGPQLRAPLSLA